MKTWIFLCLFLWQAAFADTLSLKDQLAGAEAHSFVVTEQNKTFTFLNINAKNANSLVIEEVSVPASFFAKNRMPWRVWFEKGAPGHTSWTMSQINLQTGQIEEIFSFTHNGWADVSESNSFLTKLLNLPFNPVSHKERRKIGLPPGYNSVDRRPLWNPRIFFEGQPLPEIASTAWKARWPCDGSDMSRKWIEIYLPNKDMQTETLPAYFPYWIEVEGKLGSAKIRVVDSGRGVQSPKGSLPHRAPKVVGENFTNEGLELYLQAPSYLKEFDILAEEMNGFGKSLPLPCKTYRNENRTCLFIPIEDLNQSMEPGSAYRFLISERENPANCIETLTPFIFPLI